MYCQIVVSDTTPSISSFLEVCAYRRVHPGASMTFYEIVIKSVTEFMVRAAKTRSIKPLKLGGEEVIPT